MGEGAPQVETVDKIINSSKKAVEKLLKDYSEYNEIESKLEESKKVDSNNSITNQSTNKFSLKLRPSAEPIKSEKTLNLEKELKVKGDSMYFDNPYTWIMYKFFAYRTQSTTGEMVNRNALFKGLINTESRHKICGIRMAYIDRYFQENFGKKFREFWPGETSVQDILDSDQLKKTLLDKNFIEAWYKLEHQEKADEKNEGKLLSNKWLVDAGDYEKYRTSEDGYSEEGIALILSKLDEVVNH